MTSSGRGPRAVALAYLVLAGAIALVLAASETWAVLEGGIRGCALGIGDAFFTLEGVSAAGCAQRVDVVGLPLQWFASAALLATAAWLTRRRGTTLRRVVPVGAVSAVLVGLAPLAFLLWARDFYRLALGPVELGFAIVPLAWAAVSAIVALNAWRADRRTRTGAA